VEDVIEIVIFLLFALFGIVANLAQKGKKGLEKQNARIRPVQLPNGDLLLPTGQVVPAHQIEAGWDVAPPPVPARGGRPADLVPLGARPPDLQPGGRFTVPVLMEESTSELAVNDTGTVEWIPDAEAVTLEPVGSTDWDRMAQQGRPRTRRDAVEATVVDWNAEHEIFHKKYVDVREAAPPATHGALHSIRGRQALRQAILAAEVLGPPRALRPME
jgi:hypothetical protein